MLVTSVGSQLTHQWHFLGLLFLFQLVVSGSVGRHSRVCRKFKSDFRDLTEFRDVTEVEDARCPPTSSAFNVYQVSSSTDNTDDGPVGESYTHYPILTFLIEYVVNFDML